MAPRVRNGSVSSIIDVPDDQGDWVRLDFLRSGFDFAIESTPVTRYQIYQRVDNNGQSVASGLYFYRLQARGFNVTKKMVLMV